MSEATIEAAAAPLIGDAVKAIEPEAKALLERFEAYAGEERGKLIVDLADLLNEHQSALSGWLENAFAKPPTAAAATPDPTPAPPAAPAKA